jgi:phosphohistidine phosphatase
VDAPQRILILLRHAKSDWSGDESDLQRPLAKRGRRQAPEAGRWLARHVDRIDLAVVSPATRARQTWQLAAAELATPPPSRDEPRAYAASAAVFLDLVRELPDEVSTVVLVAHNPGLEDLASTLTGQWLAMPTSALALLASTEPWASFGTSTAALLASGRPPEGAPS